MPRSLLTPLQQEVLAAFFRLEDRFFLTGGAALAGFHLGHRETKDLDLFACEDVLADGESALARVAIELGATVESVSTSPDFRRRLVRRGDAGVVVDLVRDRAPQLVTSKPVLEGVRVDPPEEIFANKLCTLLSRGEVRDLVDLRALEQAGLDLARGLAAGSRKDAGLTPAQLAWVLSEVAIPDGAAIPGNVSVDELRAYVRTLITRLTETAFPK